MSIGNLYVRFTLCPRRNNHRLPQSRVFSA